MPTLKVNLTEHQEELIENLVSSGQYRDAGEVLRAGIRLLEQQAAEDLTLALKLCAKPPVWGSPISRRGGSAPSISRNRSAGISRIWPRTP